LKPTLKGLKIPKESFSESGMPAMHQMANCKGQSPWCGGQLALHSAIAGAAWLWGAIVVPIHLVIVAWCKVLAPAIPKIIRQSHSKSASALNHDLCHHFVAT